MKFRTLNLLLVALCICIVFAKKPIVRRSAPKLCDNTDILSDFDELRKEIAKNSVPNTYLPPDFPPNHVGIKVLPNGQKCPPECMCHNLPQYGTVVIPIEGSNYLLSNGNIIPSVGAGVNIPSNILLPPVIVGGGNTPQINKNNPPVNVVVSGSSNGNVVSSGSGTLNVPSNGNIIPPASVTINMPSNGNRNPPVNVGISGSSNGNIVSSASGTLNVPSNGNRIPPASLTINMPSNGNRNPPVNVGVNGQSNGNIIPSVGAGVNIPSNILLPPLIIGGGNIPQINNNKPPVNFVISGSSNGDIVSSASGNLNIPSNGNRIPPASVTINMPSNGNRNPPVNVGVNGLSNGNIVSSASGTLNVPSNGNRIPPASLTINMPSNGNRNPPVNVGVNGNINPSVSGTIDISSNGNIVLPVNVGVNGPSNGNGILPVSGTINIQSNENTNKCPLGGLCKASQGIRNTLSNVLKIPNLIFPSLNSGSNGNLNLNGQINPSVSGTINLPSNGNGYKCPLGGLCKASQGIIKNTLSNVLKIPNLILPSLNTDSNVVSNGNLNLNGVLNGNANNYLGLDAGYNLMSSGLKFLPGNIDFGVQGNKYISWSGNGGSNLPSTSYGLYGQSNGNVNYAANADEIMPIKVQKCQPGGWCKTVNLGLNANSNLAINGNNRKCAVGSFCNLLSKFSYIPNPASLRIF